MWKNIAKWHRYKRVRFDFIQESFFSHVSRAYSAQHPKLPLLCKRARSRPHLPLQQYPRQGQRQAVRQSYQHCLACQHPSGRRNAQSYCKIRQDGCRGRKPNRKGQCFYELRRRVKTAVLRHGL